MPVAAVFPEGKTHRVKIDYVDDTGAVVTLEGDIPLVMITGPFQPPVIDPTVGLDTKWISDWLDETGLGTMGTNEPAALLEKCKAVWISANYLCPRLDINDPRLKAFSLYIVFLAVVAELPELKKMKGKGSSQKMVGVLGKVIGDIMAGKYATVEELPEVPEKMLPMVKSLFAVSQISRRDIPCFVDECKWLVECMNKTLGAAPLLENDFLDQTHETYRFLKRYAGPEPLVELAAMANTVTLPESMRSHPLVHQIMAKASAVIAATLDIKTLKISLEMDNRLSSISFWKRNGCSTEEAFRKVLQELTQDAWEFRFLCFQMRAMNKKNSRLDRFFKHVEEFIDGNTYRPLEQELEQFEKNKEEIKKVADEA